MKARRNFKGFRSGPQLQTTSKKPARRQRILFRVPRRVPLPGVFATLLVLAALWLPLLDLHRRAVETGLSRPGDFADVWTTFAPRLWGRSLLLAGVTCAFAAILGVPCGWLLARGPRALRIPARVLAAIPLGLPPVLAAAPLFSLAGNSRDPLWPCALVLATSFFPVVSFVVAAALAALPVEEEEAACTFASPWRAWSGILGRRLAPPVLGALSVVAALTLWEMGAPTLLSYPTLSSEVYRQLDTSTGDAALPGLRAALAGLPLPLVGMLLLWPLARLKPVSRAGSNGAPFARLPLVSVLGAGVLLVSPLGLLARFVFALDGRAAFALAVEGNSDAIWNTVGLATLSSLAMVALAAALSWTWREWPRRARSLVWGAAIVPGLFAPIVLAVALIEWFNAPLGGNWLALSDLRAQIYDSTYGMALWGDCARFFPLAVAILFPAILSLDEELLWAARGLGAGPLRTLWNIALPLLRPTLAGTLALIWALCAGELTVSVLVHGPGSDTLPIPIFNLLHAGIAADVAALCLVLAGLCGSAMALASWFLRGRN